MAKMQSNLSPKRFARIGWTLRGYELIFISYWPLKGCCFVAPAVFTSYLRQKVQNLDRVMCMQKPRISGKPALKLHFLMHSFSMTHMPPREKHSMIFSFSTYYNREKTR